MIRKTSPGRRAFTVLESLLAGVLFMLLLIAALSLTSAGTLAFGNTAQIQYSELDTTRAVRKVESLLAEACDYDYPISGTTLRYYNYQTGVYPPKKDTTPHTFTLTNGNLIWSDDPARPLLKNVTTFTPGSVPPTAKTNFLVITLKIQESDSTYAARGRSGGAAKTQQSMIRVTLRNFSQTGTQ